MTIRIPVFEDNLSQFLAEARRFPLLEAEEEQALARRWLDQHDPDALNRLVGSHLRLVVKIARGNRGYGLPLADLISAGNLGLVQAAHRFDPERGVRFATYASWWIRATMHEYILHSWSLIKVGTTAAQKKLFFNLRRLKKELRALDEGDLPPENVAKIAEALDVREADVVDMNRRLAARDQSLNTRVSAAEGEGSEIQDLLIDESLDPEAIFAAAEEASARRSLLNDAMSGLNKRERGILDARVLSDAPKTLQELGLEYGISRERVRQIEARAIGKLRDAMLRPPVGSSNCQHCPPENAAVHPQAA